MTLPWSGDELLHIEKDAVNGATDEHLPFSLMFRFHDSTSWEQWMSWDTCFTFSAWKLTEVIAKDIALDPESVLKDSQGHPVLFQKTGPLAMQRMTNASGWFGGWLFGRKFAQDDALRNWSHILFRAPLPERSLEQALEAMAPMATCRMSTDTPSTGFVVHFLFLMRGHMAGSLAEVWRQFFAEAPKDTWSAWAHCPVGSDCGQHGEATAPWKWVQGLKEMGCQDSISPHLELVKAALRGFELGTEEKFVLLAETTLPILPFSQIFDALKVEPGNASQIAVSDFCLHEPKEWVKSDEKHGGKTFVKHSQWTVLAKRDARALLQTWRPLTGPEASSFLYACRCWPGTEDIGTRRVPFRGACAHEIAPFALLFGLMPQHKRWGSQPHPVPLNPNLHVPYVYEKEKKQLLIQSRCRTFDTAERLESRLQLVKAALATQDLEMLEGGTSIHRLGPKAIAVLRQHGSFFAGPFSPSADLSNYTGLAKEPHPGGP